MGKGRELDGGIGAADNRSLEKLALCFTMLEFLEAYGSQYARLLFAQSKQCTEG